MKVGFSFGRCVRDIVEGDVDISDVAVIIARTHIETEEQLKGVVDAYLFRRDYLIGLDPAKCQEVALQLWDEGKIHQPRTFGKYPQTQNERYVWMDLFPSVKEVSPVVEDAWNQYRAMLHLAHGSDVPDDKREYYDR